MRNFLPFPFAPYNGGYTSKAFNNGAGRQKGTMVPLRVLWDAYKANGQNLGTNNPNFAVSFDLNTAGPNTVIGTWTIQSVYIDNMGVDFPVYIYFNDTQFPVVSPPNSAGWFQVFSNARAGLIIAEGITDATRTEQTAVYFTDVAMVPYIDYELSQGVSLFRASPSIQRGGAFSNTTFAAEALGDINNQSGISLTSTTSAGIFFAGPGPLGRQLSGFYYVTSLMINIIGQWAAAETTDFVSIVDVDAANTIIAPTYFVPTTAQFHLAPVAVTTVYNQEGQLKLDATHLWQIQHVGGALLSGIAQCFVTYTYQP